MSQNGILLSVQEGINNTPSDVRGNYSDGYHTFNELYEHRITLFVALCRVIYTFNGSGGKHLGIWRSTAHSDGSVWDGWFILGIGRELGQQITYHLPMSRWDECEFATTRDKAPEWDGHTSADVLQRLKDL